MQTAEETVVVVGAGGHGSEIQAYIEDLIRTGWRGRFLGFVDDTKPKGCEGRLEIIGGVPEFFSQPTDTLRAIRCLVALGDNGDRRTMVKKIEEFCGGLVRPWTLIHPSACLGSSEIGAGTLLAPGAVVTSRSRIGRYAILNVKSSVSHDCEIGDFVNLNPGATVCGWCHIGDSVFIGAGATVIDRVRIGEGTIIGAGAVVTTDIPARSTAVGVPARVIKTS
jgi:sugar O-acyltransferase (sialic acid O-acetyltransferase NeuD family)